LSDQDDVTEQDDDVKELVQETLLEQKAGKADKIIGGVERKVRNKAQEVSDSIIRKHMVLSDLLMDDSLFNEVDREERRDEPVTPDEEEMVLTRSLIPDLQTGLAEPSDPEGVLNATVDNVPEESVEEAPEQNERLTSDPDVSITLSPSTLSTGATSDTTRASEITTKSATTTIKEAALTTVTTTSTTASSTSNTSKLPSTMPTSKFTTTTTIPTTSSTAPLARESLTSTRTVTNTISTTLTTSTIKAASTTVESLKPEDLTIDEEEEENDKLNKVDIKDEVAPDQHCHPKDVSCQSKPKGDESFKARSDTAAVNEDCLDGETDDQHCGQVDRVMEISVDPETIFEASQATKEEPMDEIESKSSSIFSLFKSFWNWF